MPAVPVEPSAVFREGRGRAGVDNGLSCPSTPDCNPWLSAQPADIVRSSRKINNLARRACGDRGVDLGYRIGGRQGSVNGRSVRDAARDAAIGTPIIKPFGWHDV